jgi:hypothetical protein
VKNKKRWILLLIIAFPSLFWLILETSTINSKKLPIYGPRKSDSAGDTVYYQVPDKFYGILEKSNELRELTEYPIYGIIFLNQKYRDDSYRLTGLWEYLKYTKNKVEHIPFVFVTASEDGHSQAYDDLKPLSDNENIHFYSWKKTSFDSITKIYFRDKPYYIDYSFFVLVDGKRNVRGYYDGRYVSEIKRLIEEYQHLRLKEEKQKIIQSNEINSKS